MSSSDLSVSHRASLTLASEADAKRLADLLSEIFVEDQAAIAAFERPDRGWDVTVHLAEAPDEAALRELVATVTDAEVAQTLRFDTVEAKDWVRASLEGLKPVAAGRFVV